MRRVPLLLLLLLAAAPGPGAAADYTTWAGGAGSTVVYDRVVQKSVNQATLFLSPSWEGRDYDLSFDLLLRWDVDGWRMVKEWGRPGDFLRPVRKAVYRPAEAGWSAGLDILRRGGEPGPGMVLGAPDGRSEIGYAGPGLSVRVGGKGDRFRSELFSDRVVDPTMVGARGNWRVGERVSLSFEGAMDGDAPLAWSGGWDRGRPKADSTGRVWGAAGEASLGLFRGERVEVFVAGGAADLSGEASAVSGGLGVGFSFSPYYVNRLDLALRAEKGKGGYLPAYFDEPYQVERWGLPGTPPLAASLASREAGLVSSTFGRVSLRYRLGEVLSVDGDWRVEEGGDLESARLAVRLSETGERGVEVSAWSRVLAPGEKLFDTERTHARVSALYNIYSHTLLRLGYQYGWMFKEGAAAPTGASEWVAGILYSLTL